MYVNTQIRPRDNADKGSGRSSPSRMSASAREIFDVIRCFGERGKLFNVHFRNIKGKKLDVPG